MGLFSLYIRRVDHLAPFVRFGDQMLAELRRSKDKGYRAKFGQSQLELLISKPSVNFAVSLAIVSEGVLAGAPMPYHALAS